MKMILLSFFILLSFGLKAQSNIYNADDLKILSEQKSFDEFFKHALDIRPSKRNSVWVENVQNMAISFLKEISDQKNFNDKDYRTITKISLWPALKDYNFYQLSKDNYGSAYFLNCFRSNKVPSSCFNKLYIFWHSSTKQPELALRLAELVKKYNQKEVDLWMFHKVVTNSIISKFHCHRPLVFNSIQTELLKHVSNETPLSKIPAITKKIFNTPCLSAISKLLTLGLYDDNKYLRDINYLILKAHNLLADSEEDHFLTYYILQDPRVGQIFNKSFTRLKVLGQNFKRRKVVLERLKRLDPLPGHVFVHPNISKRKILFHLLSKNIPEYLKYYGQTCLDYFEGNGDFPLGTRTIECKDFFKVSKKSPVITQKLRTRYSSVLKAFK